MTPLCAFHALEAEHDGVVLPPRFVAAPDGPCASCEEERAERAFGPERAGAAELN